MVETSNKYILGVCNMAKDASVINVMTDPTGQFHRVVMVAQHENLVAYEKNMEAMQNPTPEMKAAMEKMKGFQDMYVSGSREIYRIW